MYRENASADGYLTVYLALTISILMSLILTLFYGARVGAVRMKTEFVADIAMNSILAEYHRQLYEQYGLLMVDTSYGSGNPSILNTEEHLRNYVGKNFAVSDAGKLMSQVTLMKTASTQAHITGYSLAADGDDAVMHRAIYGYMGGGVLDDVFNDTERNLEELNDSGYDSVDVEEMAAGYSEQLDATYEIDTDGDGVVENVRPDTPGAAVTSLKGVGILTLAAAGIDISDAAVDENTFFSHGTPLHGTGLSDYEKTGLLDRAVFYRYCSEKCSYFGNELDKSRLKYQLEYIYAGTGSDWKNLEKVCEAIFLWKEASNLACILNSPSLMAQAEALALTASILLYVPELYEAIKWSVILAWSFAESVADIHILLSGGKVPLVKTEETWTLSIEHLIDFRDHLSEGCGQGLDYEQYLMMLLFLQNMKRSTDRLMDMMQLDIRQTEGNERFRIDGCMDVLCAEIIVESVSGGTHKVERIYGYE